MTVNYFRQLTDSTVSHSRGVSLEDRIKAAAAAVGIRGITAVAKRSGLNRGTLYAAFKRERDGGTHDIDGATAQALAKTLNRSAAWIIGETGPIVDTLAMAQEAVAKLESHSLIKDGAAAWSSLRDVRLAKPSVEAFAREVIRRSIDIEEGVVDAPARAEVLTLPPSPPKKKRSRKAG